MVAFYCLVSAFKGVCHLPGNNGFSSLVTVSSSLAVRIPVSKRQAIGEEVGVGLAPSSAGSAHNYLLLSGARQPWEGK